MFATIRNLSVLALALAVVAGVSPMTALGQATNDSSTWEVQYEGVGTPDSVGFTEENFGPGADPTWQGSQTGLGGLDDMVLVGTSSNLTEAVWNMNPSAATGNANAISIEFRIRSISGVHVFISKHDNGSTEAGTFVDPADGTLNTSGSQAPGGVVAGTVTNWQVYRTTIEGSNRQMYLNDDPTPILVWDFAFAGDDILNFGFGGAGAGGGIWHIDYFRATGMGAFVPGAPTATTFTWNIDDSGNWSASNNWTRDGHGSFPNSPKVTAIFGSEIMSPQTVFTNTEVSVNRIEFSNATHSYAVAGHGSVNLFATTDPNSPVNPSISVEGTHLFQAAVNLHAPTTADVASGSVLTFDGALNLSGTTLTKTGDGTLTVNNRVTLGGGSVINAGGVISGFGTIGGDVDNQGGTISPGNSQAIQSIADGDAAVPEPGGLVLLLMGMLAWTWQSFFLLTKSAAFPIDPC